MISKDILNFFGFLNKRTNRFEYRLEEFTGISQFFYGPLSDIYGRRLIILVGLSIFCIANLLAVFSTTFGVFLTSRILQGIGIGCGDTMGRAILCDCFKTNEFVMAACYIGLAATVTPMISPVIGGYIEVFFNWRANFIFILLSGMIVMSIIFINLPETKSKANASKIAFISEAHHLLTKAIRKI